jgi:hypothetical protein
MVVRIFIKALRYNLNVKSIWTPPNPFWVSFFTNSDLYGDSAPYENTQRAYRQPRPQPSSNSRYSRPPPQKEISYTDLKVPLR